MINSNRKIKMKIIIYVFLVLAAFVIAGCSKLIDSISPAPEVNIHDSGNLNPAAQDFHGLKVAQSSNGWQECLKCHGGDFSGGKVEISCNNNACHPTINVHVDGIIDTLSNNFHGKFLRQHDWNMLDCKACHGDNYSGGLASPDCTTCHTQPKGPEACNTCHGDFNNPDIIAPPRDTHDNTSTDAPGVGAHVSHLYSNDLGHNIECATCHIVPQNFADQGHIDNTPDAEITFGNLAVRNIALNPVYNYSSVTCSDTYCHGNFEFLKSDAPASHQFAYVDGADRMTGDNQSVVWNIVDGSQMECGSCHGLPPTGHIEANLTGCGTCHGTMDRNGNFVDSLVYKHIDGNVDIIF